MVRITQWKKNGKRGWEVDLRITLPDGSKVRERVKSPVTSRSGTEAWAKKREAAIIERGGRKDEGPREPIPTLGVFWPRFVEGHSLANREKPSSVHAKQSIYTNHLAPRFGDVPLDQIGDEDVQRLKAALRDRSVKTINNVLTVLNRLLKAALEWNVIDHMPCRIRLLKAAQASVEFYEPEVYDALVDAAAKQDDRIHVAVLLGGDGGLRQGEIVALEWADVDFRRGQLTVRRSEWHGEATLPKGGKERVVPMTRRLAAALSAHRHLRGARVLVQDDGAPVNRAWLWYAMKGAQRRAGMAQDGRFHILRHTFCSRLAMLDVPAMSIKELAGHVNLQTTQRYLHLSSKAKGQAIHALDAAHAAQTRGDLGETGTPAEEKLNA